MQKQGPDEGQIRGPLKQDEPLQPGEIEVSQVEADKLRRLELHERVDALRGLRDHHNQRRRKQAREEAKAKAKEAKPKSGKGKRHE